MKYKYLILMELDREGFILDIVDFFEDAKWIVDEIFNLSEQVAYSEIITKARIKPIASYEINGNELYTGRIQYGQSNGLLSVSVMKIDTDKFCIKSFISERRNHSSVFDYEKYEDELERLAEKFPKFQHGAN
jgi:hypothetical protein